ncbi:MAG: 30S ribosomal protein S4, partial [Candidatus Zixiibacteriota bacterium]
RARKMSNYKIRLLEKQRLRFSYWISEKQFRRYAKKAFGQPGNTGENLLRLLERRLDNAVYRFGFAPTILSARQMISHGHILVNGSKMDKPSYMVRQADLVSVREGSKRLPLVEEGVARSQARPQLSYFEFDRKNLRGTLTEIPSREQIPLAINEALVVEYYAKYI